MATRKHPTSLAEARRAIASNEVSVRGADSDGRPHSRARTLYRLVERMEMETELETLITQIEGRNPLEIATFDPPRLSDSKI